MAKLVSFFVRAMVEIDDANFQVALGEGMGMEKVKRSAAMHGQSPGMPQLMLWQWTALPQNLVLFLAATTANLGYCADVAV